MKKSHFEVIQGRTPKDIQIFIEKSFDIADEIDFVLDSKKMNRAHLASDLNKSESEISKWLSGIHNLTIKTISKIEAVLGETIISTPTSEAKKHQELIKSLEEKVKHLQEKVEHLTKQNKELSMFSLELNYSSDHKFKHLEHSFFSNCVKEISTQIIHHSPKEGVRNWSKTSEPAIISNMHFAWDEYENTAI